MKFECKPRLILTKEEFGILDGALKLCQDMDKMTDDDGCGKCPVIGCEDIPGGCLFIRTKNLLKQITDIAIVK